MRRAIVSVAAAIACVIACDDSPTSHDYLALQYDPVQGCYDDSTAIDVVPGGDGSLECAPQCLVFGSTIYVSTMCGPYPPEFNDTSGTNPGCAAALAAYAGGCSCDPQDDGGLACPSPSAAGDDAGGGDSSASGDDAPSPSGDDGPTGG